MPYPSDDRPASLSPFEEGDNLASYEVAHVWEEVGHRKAFDFSRRSYVENWKKGELGVSVYFRTRPEVSALDSRQYLVTFDPPSKMADFCDVGGTCADVKRGRVLHYRGRRDRKGAVLVPVVDGLQLEKKLPSGLLPAVVRLYTLDVPDDLIGNARHRSILRIGEPLAGARNRKLYPILGFPVCGFGASEDEVVQDRPELLRDLSDQNGAGWGEGLDLDHPHNGVPVSVDLMRDSVKVRFTMALAKQVQSFEVLIRSSHLKPYLIYRTAHG